MELVREPRAPALGDDVEPLEPAAPIGSPSLTAISVRVPGSATAAVQRARTAARGYGYVSGGKMCARAASDASS